MSEHRPSPDALLRAVAREERGRLKIFLGAAPGVGKTFEMLREGAERQRNGTDVVIAVVETHGRSETEALVVPLETVARRTVAYRGHELTEMDIDAVLARRPTLALVDELAHSNADGSRHPKRWQDVVELLDAGIDVYTTLNVQHVESLNDVVASFTRVRVRETVPDTIFDRAEVEVVDLPPDELIDRLKAGKVYIPAEATRALGSFFSRENLSALREMALRRAAESVDRAMLEHLDAHAVPGSFAGGERVLIAVNELPGVDALVRAAKRLADALRAPWRAVFIETPRAAGFNDDERRRVADALQLAQTLGATIATVPAENVTTGLRAQLVAARATQLVIGKSRRSRWFEWRHGSVVDAMLRSENGLAVHVIPATVAPMRRARRPVAVWRDWPGYLLAATLVGLTTGLGELARPLLGAGGIDLLYLLAAIVAAARLGLRPGIAAAIAGGLAYNFFFLPPLYTFTIADPQSLLTMFVLIGVAAFTANLTGRLRTRASVGVRSAEENAAIAEFGQALARAADRGETSRIVAQEIARLLDAETIVLAERDGQPTVLASSRAELPQLDPIDRAAADWAATRGEAAGAETATLGAAEWQYHPLKTALGTLALIGLARREGEAPVPVDRAVLLATLLGQAALAHERLALEDQLREVSVLKERDRLRAALLSSIGHDLRTPLTGVAAAIDALAAEQPDSPAAPVARAEAARLRRFLDNLLDMVRLDTGAVNVALEPTDLTDAVASAAHDLRDLLGPDQIRLSIPPDLPLVSADPRLLHHVLLNLLTNAAKHGGPGPIEITGRRLPDSVTVTVRDHGPGLADPAAGFGTFASGAGSDRLGGSGLGLAIAKGFADAMSIKLTGDNASSGGAVFSLSLAPLSIGHDTV